MPDPEAARVRDALDAWIASGERRDEAVETLARACAARGDAHLAKSIDRALPQSGSRQRRARALRDLIAHLEKNGA